MPKADGSGEDRAEFTGQRLPPMSPVPDLSQLKFGEPVSLFDGKSLNVAPCRTGHSQWLECP
jgi:hypothetical protein